MKYFLIITSLLSTLLLSNTMQTQNQEMTPSFFSLYEQNRHEQVPNYITLDFILTATYLYKQQSITEMEEKEMFGDLQTLVKNMKTQLLKTYTAEKKEALAYVLVVNELMGEVSTDVPKDALHLAYKELALIAKHKDIATSPLAKVKVDYTQFKVRAKYTKRSLLSSYFLALKYMSGIPFMVNAHPATGVSQIIADTQVKNAMYLAEALRPFSELYASIEKKLKLLSGEGDDLSFMQVLKDANVSTVRKELNTLNHVPMINERILDTTQIKTEDIGKATLALKLLPSRFSPDGYIYSKLTYPFVGELKRKSDKLTSFIDGKNVRGYPTIMDIAAVLIDDTPAERHYENYGTQVKKLQQDMNFTLDNIYAYDFAIYKQLLKEGKTNSFKGFYTQSKYIMNLYQKQSYTGGLKGMFIESRKEAYLEDNISKVLGLIVEELKLFPDSETFSTLILKLKTLAEKTKPFSAKDIKFLNEIDMQFKAILNSVDTPIKVDIHTNPVEGKVMYESLENPFVIMKKKARGAVYNHKEFVGSR